MKLETRNLIDISLDWAVTVINYRLVHGVGYITCINPNKGWIGRDEHLYSTDWSQGGPIIERERIAVQFGPQWTAVHNRRLGRPSYGPTPLIAAMRCFVTSRLGEELEIPDGLFQHQNETL